MIITLQIFLYVYLAFLVVWGVFFAVALYHMLRYSFRSMVSIMFVTMFFGVALLLLFVSLGFIQKINWQEEINFFGDLKDQVAINF